MREQKLIKQLEERNKLSCYRTRIIVEGPQTTLLKSRGKTYLNFCSNDYLGLANHPKIKKSFMQAAEKFGVGSGAAHLVNGHSSEHHALEEELAEFTGRERALLFSTGYMANMGVLSALAGKGDLILQDKLNHASLIDGALLSRADFKRFKHNDLAHAEQLLSASQAETTVLAVDGVFSMDGDLAPLPQLAELALEHSAWLMVDDAHAMGCLGKTGAGSCELYQLNATQVPILMGTLGKAFGTSGAFVAGSAVLIESLIQFARTYIYTTASPPAVAAASRTSLQLVKEESWRREKLQQHIAFFRKEANLQGWQLMNSHSPIQPLILGDESLALAASNQLRDLGIWVTAIRPPTVPQGTARLRITFSAEHTEEQLLQLLEALRKVLG